MESGEGAYVTSIMGGIWGNQRQKVTTGLTVSVQKQSFLNWTTFYSKKSLKLDEY